MVEQLEKIISVNGHKNQLRWLKKTNGKLYEHFGETKESFTDELN